MEIDVIWPLDLIVSYRKCRLRIALLYQEMKYAMIVTKIGIPGYVVISNRAKIHRNEIPITLSALDFLKVAFQFV